MARYRIVHWREIPSLVEAFEGRDVVSLPLSPRFQELIDAVALREGASGTEAYLDGWGQSGELERPGGPREVAEEVAAELEAEFPALLARRLPPPAPPG
jgi:hypothetical protein